MGSLGSLPDEGSQEPSDEQVAKVLSDRGWRQGTVFRAQGVSLPCVAVTRTSTGNEFVVAEKAIPSDGRFVVASQSCDIHAPMKIEPTVEAFACDIEPNPSVRSSFVKSFRRFEIDPTEGLMANAAYCIPFDKRALLSIDAEPWPGSARRLTRYSDWIGRRASRSALSDEIVEAFVRPLGKMLDKMKGRQRDEYGHFIEAVAQIRMVPPMQETEPFDINLIFLQESNMLTSEQADAIELVIANLKAVLDPSKATLVSVKQTSWSRMSTEEYFFGSVHVELEYLSYDGLELIGAQPFGPS
jgi:hypothetical protein